MLRYELSIGTDSKEIIQLSFIKEFKVLTRSSKFRFTEDIPFLIRNVSHKEIWDRSVFTRDNFKKEIFEELESYKKILSIEISKIYSSSPWTVTVLPNIEPKFCFEPRSSEIRV